METLQERLARMDAESAASRFNLKPFVSSGSKRANPNATPFTKEMQDFLKKGVNLTKALLFSSTEKAEMEIPDFGTADMLATAGKLSTDDIARAFERSGYELKWVQMLPVYAILGGKDLSNHCIVTKKVNLEAFIAFAETSPISVANKLKLSKDEQQSLTGNDPEYTVALKVLDFLGVKLAIQITDKDQDVTVVKKLILHGLPRSKRGRKAFSKIPAAKGSPSVRARPRDEQPDLQSMSLPSLSLVDVFSAVKDAEKIKVLADTIGLSSLRCSDIQKFNDVQDEVRLTHLAWREDGDEKTVKTIDELTVSGVKKAIGLTRSDKIAFTTLTTLGAALSQHGWHLFHEVTTEGAETLQFDELRKPSSQSRKEFYNRLKDKTDFGRRNISKDATYDPTEDYGTELINSTISEESLDPKSIAGATELLDALACDLILTFRAGRQDWAEVKDISIEELAAAAERDPALKDVPSFQKLVAASPEISTSVTNTAALLDQMAKIKIPAFWIARPWDALRKDRYFRSLEVSAPE